MAVNIGPKIGIDGEAEYRKQINAIIQQAKTLDSEMRVVTSSFDKHTSAQSKNAAEAQVLSKQIENQKNRVRELNDMLEKSKEKFGENSTKTQRWQQSVNNATAELNTMQRRMNEISPGGLDSLQSKLSGIAANCKEVGEKLSDVGMKLTTNVTGPIAAFATASMAAFEKVDAAEDEAIKKTGATGDAAKALQGNVEDVATSMAGANVDWSTIGDTVGLVSTRFGVTGDSLNSLSEQFLEFSQNTGSDTKTAITDVSMAMSAFGVSSDQTGSVLGVLQATTQKTGIDIGTLTGDLNTSGASFREMGFSIGDATSFMGQLEAQGVPVDQALQGLKKAATNCADSGTDMGTKMRDLATRLKDPATQAQATQEALDLFGNRSGLVLAQAMADGRVSLDGMSGDLSSYAGTVDETFSQTVDGADSMKQGLKEVQLAGKEFGEAIGGTLGPIMKELADKIRGVGEWFKGLPAPMKDFIVKAALIAAAIGPILLVVGKIIAVIGTVISAVSTIAGVVIPIITVIVGAIGWPIVAIAAVIVAIIAIATHWQEVSAVLMQMWQGLQDFFSGIWNAIVGAFTGAVDVIQGAWSGITGFFGGVWDGIVSVFSAVGQWFSDTFNAAVTGIQSVWNGVTGFFGGIWSGIQGIFGGVGQWFQDTFQGAVHSIQDAFGGIGQWFEDLFNNIHIPTFHVSGGFNLDPAHFELPSIEWYKTGGIFSSPSIIGVGEAGTEAVAPISELNKYMTAQSGPTYNLYIDGIRYNDGDAMDSRITNFVDAIIMKGAMFNGSN